MSRELVRIGDDEVIVGDFLWGTTRPTDVEFRAYIIEGTTKKYDNGVAFTVTDATLPRTFAGGIGYATYTFPAYALDLEVRLEAKPIGFPAEAPEDVAKPEEDSRFVVESFASAVDLTPVLNAIAAIQADVDAVQASLGTDATTAHAKLNEIRSKVDQLSLNLSGSFEFG